jgi:ethanolamine ammonia-lyase large subunit
MHLQTTLRGKNYTFRDLRDLMAKANEPKSGDRLAGLAASSAMERMAARILLAEVKVGDFLDHPLVAPESDSVSRRILESLDPLTRDETAGWTVGELRERILQSSGTAVAKWGRGLSSDAIAAAARLMTNLDLVVGASKLRVFSTNRTTLGLPGTFSSRLQPNHPVDDLAGILASVRDGFSYGVGDALVGINPADDSVAAVRRTLDGVSAYVHDVLEVPTQVCVLAHVTTQMAAIAQGARCDVVFQSIAGTQAGCESFGIPSLEIFDEAAQAVREGRSDLGPNVLYFETGEGSELSSDSHHGVDQLTLESRCYGLARTFDPFLVNSVVGFIGPEYLFDGREVIRAGLEDHFMGKMHGLPMGVDVCHTNAMDADQNDLDNLLVLLATAGCNFVMGVPMSDDIMLNYQSTSFHDVAAVRELLGKRAAPAFEAWMESREILDGGRLAPMAGDPTWIERSRRLEWTPS